MKIDIYGRIIEVLKEDGFWNIYTLGEGKKMRANDIVIPQNFSEKEVLTFLADMFHEAATPEKNQVRIID